MHYNAATIDCLKKHEWMHFKVELWGIVTVNYIPSAWHQKAKAWQWEITSTRQCNDKVTLFWLPSMWKTLLICCTGQLESQTKLKFLYLSRMTYKVQIRQEGNSDKFPCFLQLQIAFPRFDWLLTCALILFCLWFSLSIARNSWEYT